MAIIEPGYKACGTFGEPERPMNTNDPGREPEPTDAELAELLDLVDAAKEWGREEISSGDMMTEAEHRLAMAVSRIPTATIARLRLYTLSGARPMPDDAKNLCVMVGHSVRHGGYCVFEEVDEGEYCKIKGPYETRELAEAAMREASPPAPDEVEQPAQFLIGWDEMPPEDVLRAEAKLSFWMRERRIKEWELGRSADRDIVIRLRACLDDAEQDRNALTARVAALEALVKKFDTENATTFRSVPTVNMDDDMVRLVVDLPRTEWRLIKAVSSGKEPTDAE